MLKHKGKYTTGEELWIKGDFPPSPHKKWKVKFISAQKALPGAEPEGVNVQYLEDNAREFITWDRILDHAPMGIPTDAVSAP